jgi:hypothetical protein
MNVVYVSFLFDDARAPLVRPTLKITQVSRQTVAGRSSLIFRPDPMAFSMCQTPTFKVGPAPEAFEIRTIEVYT